MTEAEIIEAMARAMLADLDPEFSWEEAELPRQKYWLKIADSALSALTAKGYAVVPRVFPEIVLRMQKGEKLNPESEKILYDNLNNLYL